MQKPHTRGMSRAKDLYRQVRSNKKKVEALGRRPMHDLLLSWCFSARVLLELVDSKADIKACLWVLKVAMGIAANWNLRIICFEHHNRSTWERRALQAKKRARTALIVGDMARRARRILATLSKPNAATTHREEVSQ